jgi:hypothetical protein
MGYTLSHDLGVVPSFKKGNKGLQASLPLAAFDLALDL